MPSTCWASTSSAPGRDGGVSCAPSSAASSAAWHSTTSKRLAGTSSAFDGSSRRWLDAADALGQPAGAFRRADIDDEIDVAPVDAEIERRGADHRAQFAGHHGRFDLAALADVERAVVQRDREIVVVVAPQRLEQHLGLGARVDEHERHAVGLDRLVDLGQRIAGRMSGPRQLGFGLEDRHVGLEPGADLDDLGEPRTALALVRHQERRQLRRPRHGRGQPDGDEIGRQRAQPREIERQEIAALGRGERVQLVDDHGLERAEQRRRHRDGTASARSAPAW